MAAFRTFLRLPKTEKSLVLRAFLYVAAIRVMLWVMPTRSIQRLVDSNSLSSPQSAAVNSERVQTIVGYVKTVSRYVPRASCLTQALAALLLLRESGQTVEMKIGVAKDDRSGLIAHAWLEKDGQIILGAVPDQRRYVTLEALSL